MAWRVRRMDDVLSHGMDREPNRWPRRLGALAVACCLVVAVVLDGRPDRELAAPRPGTPAILAAGPVQLAGLGSGAAWMLNESAGATAQALTHYPGPSPTNWWALPRTRGPLACRAASRRPPGAPRSQLCALVSPQPRR